MAILQNERMSHQQKVYLDEEDEYRDELDENSKKLQEEFDRQFEYNMQMVHGSNNIHLSGTPGECELDFEGQEVRTLSSRDLMDSFTPLKAKQTGTFHSKPRLTTKETSLHVSSNGNVYGYLYKKSPSIFKGWQLR